MIYIFYIFSLAASAEPVPKGTNVMGYLQVGDGFNNGSAVQSLDSSFPQKQPEPEQKASAPKSLPRKSTSVIRTEKGVDAGSNLPAYLGSGKRSDFQANESAVLTLKNKVSLTGVHIGDEFVAIVNQQIKASPSVPTPVRAYILNGDIKGGYFVGEATLDKELKRILLDFSHLKLASGKVYNLKAKGLSPIGSIGIEGEYHSQAGLFFLGELASATAAGLLDAQINRNQTSFGTYVQDPSFGNSAKTGAVTAASKTADAMAEKTRNAPEYTTSKDDFEIRVFVQDEPTENGGG